MDDLLLLIYLSPFLYELYPELSGEKKEKEKILLQNKRIW